MKRIATLFLLVAACASAPQPATTTTTTGTTTPATTTESADREMLDLMDRYIADPFGSDADAAKRIAAFVINSDAVQVVIDERAAPWTADASIDGDNRSRLLIAYMAGNAAAQLRSGRKGDDLHAGTAAALKVYAAAKARQPALVSADLDKLAALDAKGQLTAHLDAVAAARAKK